jgi:phenylpropionate dioxygenase-like ring-hydroxylating dioxygenase large terminal subunit
MAKAAHVADYDINANWKLVYENNRCVHRWKCPSFLAWN